MECLEASRTALSPSLREAPDLHAIALETEL